MEEQEEREEDFESVGELFANDEGGGGCREPAFMFAVGRKCNCKVAGKGANCLASSNGGGAVVIDVVVEILLVEAVCCICGLMLTSGSISSDF